MGLNPGGPHPVNSVVSSPDPRRVIVEALLETEGNMLQAAHNLGINRKTLWHYVTKMGLWPVVNRIRRERKAKRDRGRSKVCLTT